MYSNTFQGVPHIYNPKMYLAASAEIGAPVGTPGNGPEDPAMSTWEYLIGWSESIPCWKKNKIKCIELET